MSEYNEAYALKSLDDKVFIIDAPNWTGVPNRANLVVGLTMRSVRAHAARGTSYILGQLYGLVGPGLITAKHAFKGLRRDMRVGDDNDAANEKCVLTWSPNRDARLIGGPHAAEIEWSPAPAGRVFATYISPNKMLEEFPSIDGWIEHWAWLAADPALPGAPVDWKIRYDSKAWSAQ